MDFENTTTPEIRMAPTVKPIKDVPKRPETKRKSMCDMSKDELMEFAAERLIGLMATFDEKLYRTDTAYKNTFDIEFMYGVAAYAMLGFRDVGFPVSQFLEQYGKSLQRVQIKKRILE
ncbi:MAG: hypothetical protein WC365_09165 [Candidatus Babeliales bacterium]|jgi:hypothetical protein